MTAAFHRIGACLVLAALVGCNQGEEGDGLAREAVTGTVNFDGKPLPAGSIAFIPTPDPNRGGGATGEIKDGKFEIPKDRGPAAGLYSVAISSATGITVSPDEPPGEAPKPKPDPIPKKYNKATTLNAEIKAGQPNEFKYDLDPK